MALTTCRECGRSVNEQAPKCPHCGVQWPSRGEHTVTRRAILGCIGAALLVSLLFLGWCSYATRDRGEPSASTPTLARPAG